LFPGRISGVVVTFCFINWKECFFVIVQSGNNEECF
jgi:hypothetical protein